MNGLPPGIADCAPLEHVPPKKDSRLQAMEMALNLAYNRPQLTVSETMRLAERVHRFLTKEKERPGQ